MAMQGEGFWQWARRFWPWPGPAVAEPEAPSRIHSPGEMPGIKIGGFALVRTFAQGAFGELHLATDPASGLPVALKTVRFAGTPQARERFLRETAAAARLNHPGIVATYASGIEGSSDAAMGWMAMEWVPGHDLSRYTEPSRLLPEALVLDIAVQVADALAHAHAMGVIHRDLKPSNILVNLGSGTVKVTDFGCARLTDADRSRSGVLVGSPGYMAPEQVAGQAVDGRCDLYALGVAIFQLLTGRLPFEGPSIGELLTQITCQRAPSLSDLRPDLPPLLGDIVARSLAKLPQDRQVDAAQLGRELRLISGTLGAPMQRRNTAGDNSEAQCAITP